MPNNLDTRTGTTRVAVVDPETEAPEIGDATNESIASVYASLAKPRTPALAESQTAAHPRADSQLESRAADFESGLEASQTTAYQLVETGLAKSRSVAYQVVESRLAESRSAAYQEVESRLTEPRAAAYQQIDSQLAAYRAAAYQQIDSQLAAYRTAADQRAGSPAEEIETELDQTSAKGWKNVFHEAVQVAFGLAGP